ncbi:hypothetical protein KC217_22530, partial [Mycobacterium tuberculosis]|nr:hypothetical protein [Mycobacterium tuberculosis]
ITAPRGWGPVRRAGAVPSHADEEDLGGVGDGVRGGGAGAGRRDASRAAQGGGRPGRACPTAASCWA